MSENVLETLQQLVQDVVAPDLRELKVRVASLEKLFDARFDVLEQETVARFQKIDAQFKSLDQKTDAQFSAILAAIAESKAQVEVSTIAQYRPPRERVAVLEAQRH